MSLMLVWQVLAHLWRNLPKPSNRKKKRMFGMVALMTIQTKTLRSETYLTTNAKADLESSRVIRHSLLLDSWLLLDTKVLFEWINKVASIIKNLASLTFFAAACEFKDSKIHSK